MLLERRIVHTPAWDLALQIAPKAQQEHGVLVIRIGEFVASSSKCPFKSINRNRRVLIRERKRAGGLDILWTIFSSVKEVISFFELTGNIIDSGVAR